MSERVLVVRCGALGDGVNITALIHHLAARSGQPVDVLASGGWAPSLYQGLDAIGDLRLLASRRAPWWLSQRGRETVAWLRERAHSAVWVCENGPPALLRLIARHAGGGQAVQIRECDHRRGLSEHTLVHHRRLADMTPHGLDLPELPAATGFAPQLVVTAEERAACRQWVLKRGLADRRLVVLQPGNKRTMKRRWRTMPEDDGRKFWPVERWQAVVDGVLAHDPSIAVVIAGAPAEQPLACQIADGRPGDRVQAVADDLPLRRLLALLEQAVSCISVDTGPAHCAAALGCPLVVVFGGTDPRVHRPWSNPAPVTVVAPCAEPSADQRWPADAAITGVTTQQVIDAAIAQL